MGDGGGREKATRTFTICPIVALIVPVASSDSSFGAVVSERLIARWRREHVGYRMAV
jgi:hypothetical protein